MKPGIYDFTIYQGSTLSRTFIIDSEDFNLDDYDSIRMNIRSRTDSNIIWNSAVSGSLIKQSDRIVLIIPANITELFDFKEAGYDIELVKDESTDVVDKILRGTITLIKEYTKAAA